MSIRSRIAKPTGAPTAALLLLLLAALPPAARAQCSLNNATTWCAHQDSNGVSGGAEADDHFAGALAFGDFNGDGFDDLAVGVPGENNGAGFVYVFYSNGLILQVAGHQLISQDQTGGLDEGAENGDAFGTTLAAGDFDHDGFDDLAVGSPFESLPDPGLFGSCIGLPGTCVEIGLVQVIPGSATGLQPTTAVALSASEMEIGTVAHEHAEIGTALASYRQNNDTFDDLMVGAPGAKNDDTTERGLVARLHGSDSGLEPFDALGNTPIEQDERFGLALAGGRIAPAGGRGLTVGTPLRDLGGTDVGEVVIFGLAGDLNIELRQIDYSTAGEASSDRFGAAVAVGDFDGNGFDDVAASAPGKNHGTGNPNDSGRVYVAYNDGNGVDPSAAPDVIGEDEWAGDTPGEGELFGSALAAGDVDGDGFDDLLAGAPGEGSFDVGRIYLKRGSATGLTTVGNELFTQTFLGGSNGTDDHLGNVIALGDVDGDGVLEIALGVPDKDVGTSDDAGMVYVTRAFGPRVFADGFESGSKAAWSASTP